MGGAQFIPDRAADIRFTPYGNLAATNVQTALEELDAEKTSAAASVFAWADDWVNIQDYGAAGVVTTTTLAATLNAGSTSATLTSASSFAIGHGMAIPGAGAAGVELVVILTNVVGNVVSWSGATSTLVSAGQTIHHDDTQALLDALASLKNVYIPVGDYNTQGGQYNNVIQMTTIGQWIQGGGCDLRMRTQSAPVTGSVIYSRSLTKDCIQMIANNTHLKDVTLAVNATLSISKTAGTGLVLGDHNRLATHGNSLGPTYGAVIERVGICHFWDDFKVDLASACYIDKLYCTSPHRYAIYGSSVGPSGGNWFQNIQCYPLGYYGSTVIAGIFIDQMDTNKWVNINCIGFPNNFYLRSDLGSINTQVFSGFTNENPASTANYNIRLERTNYYLSQCTFTGGECLQGTIYVGQNVSDCTFVGITDVMPNMGTAVYVLGNNIKFLGLNIGWHAGVSPYIGVRIGSTANGTQIVGCSVWMMTVGLQIDDGATNTVISGNVIRNNTTPYVISETARANSRIEGNIGVPDYGTSIAATPGYVGQEALSGGQFYKAVGTSSSADWKQTTA